MKQYTPLSY